MRDIDQDQKAFDDLPTFDARKFEPPSWAKDLGSRSSKNGESSRSRAGPTAKSGNAGKGDSGQSGGAGEDEVDPDDTLVDDDEDQEEDVWEDARSDVDPDEAKFTLPELKELLSRAIGFKETGNKAFTARPPKHEDAVQSYLSAIDHLPNIPVGPQTCTSQQPELAGGSGSGSGIVEVSDDEAARIHEENERAGGDEERERRDVESEIRDTTRACWGNLAACYIALKEDQKAVDACTEALKIDPRYVKGLHRRATSNERIGSLTALSSAKEDYTLLLTLLPRSSPLLPTVRRSLSTLPDRIKLAEKAQMDEMMGKLKDLGNMFLGNFGLSTDNFKFDKGEGGGYNMQFQR